jgi:hypothetical protein
LGNIEIESDELISENFKDEISLSSSNKYEVSQVTRYLKKNITKKHDNNPLEIETNTWLKTNIIKDKVLNSKEIKIKKIFIVNN